MIHLATITAINSPGRQTYAGLSTTINYATQDKKTVWNGEKLVGSLNCIADQAPREFVNTKRIFGKDSGKMFFHFVISFHPDEKITPKQCHEYVMDFAKRKWGNHEVVVATHSDADHIHSHCIINSVSFADGKKYHCDSNEYQSLQKLNDEMCVKYGYTVPKKRKKEERLTAMKQSEYHSAMKLESWKMELRIAIDDAMKYADSREHFIGLLRSEGYQIRWTADRKSITYTHPNGLKCRDYRLGENKYLKGNMENEFTIRQQINTGTIEKSYENDNGYGGRHADTRDDNGQELGSAERRHSASRGDSGKELGNALPYGNIGSDGFKAGETGDTHSQRTDGNRNEYLGDASRNTEDPKSTDRSLERTDENIDTRDNITGWEREREFFLGLLGDDKDSEKTTMDSIPLQSDPVNSNADIGHSALGLLDGLSRIAEGDPPRANENAADDDIDKKLREEERRIKSGMNISY